MTTDAEHSSQRTENPRDLQRGIHKIIPIFTYIHSWFPAGPHLREARLTIQWFTYSICSAWLGSRLCWLLNIVHITIV